MPPTPQVSNQRSGGPTLRACAAGQVLCREGDPAGPVYVICSGAVRVFRRSLTTAGVVDELARLGPGAVVGELAVLLQQVRSATVQAIEPTQVLEIPIHRIREVVGQNASLVQVITAALHDRTELSEPEISSIVGRVVGAGPVSAPEPDGVSLPVPPHDTTIAYPKALTCPACGAQFSTLLVHPHKDRPVERASDFHRRYATSFNPNDYELYVCPRDLYAALPVDFGPISDTHQSKVAQVVETVVAAWSDGRPDFNAERTHQLREQGLQLALALYRMRQLPSARTAAIAHRLAWCARERGDTSLEQRWLTQALQAYATAYEDSQLDGPRDELRVQYLCGELSGRLGDVPTAVRWFEEAIRHPAIKQYPNWLRMVRDQWARLRADEVSPELEAV